MYYVGIDIGGTKSAVTVGSGYNGTMNICRKRKFATPQIEPAKVLDLYVREICALLDEQGLTANDITGIGISCGGPLDSRRGVIESPPNLPAWDNVHIVDFIKNTFQVNTYLQNDANACAVAEWKYGAGRGYRNVIFLTFGTGLGAGLILDGRLYTGTNDMAGEIGHVRLAATGPVGYGKIGSMEAFCSGGGIRQLAEMMANDDLAKGNQPRLLAAAGSARNINAKLVADLADENDSLCKSVYDISANKLGQGLSILIDVLNPEVIIIGSIFTRSMHLFYDETYKEIEKEALAQSRSVCRVLPSELGEHVGDYAALSIATGEY